MGYTQKLGNVAREQKDSPGEVGVTSAEVQAYTCVWSEGHWSIRQTKETQG